VSAKSWFIGVPARQSRSKWLTRRADFLPVGKTKNPEKDLSCGKTKNTDRFLKPLLPTFKETLQEAISIAPSSWLAVHVFLVNWNSTFFFSPLLLFTQPPFCSCCSLFHLSPFFSLSHFSSSRSLSLFSLFSPSLSHSLFSLSLSLSLSFVFALVVLRWPPENEIKNGNRWWWVLSVFTTILVRDSFDLFLRFLIAFTFISRQFLCWTCSIKCRE